MRSLCRALPRSRRSSSTMIRATARPRRCGFPTSASGYTSPMPISASPPPTILPRPTARRLGSRRSIPMPLPAKPGSRSCIAPLCATQASGCSGRPSSMRESPIAWTASATSIPSSARRGAGHRALPSARCRLTIARCSLHALPPPFTPATPISLPADSMRASFAISRTSISAFAWRSAANAAFKCAAPRSSTSDR